MKKLIVIALGIAVAATTATAQMKPPQKVMMPTTPSNSPLQITQTQVNDVGLAAATRITRDEAAKLVKAGKAIYVDVRSKQTYDKGHIKGAYNAPNSQIIQRLRELPPRKMLITYCACEAEHTAAQAVIKLSAHGVKNSAALVGGWNEWTALGLPTEKTK